MNYFWYFETFAKNNQGLYSHCTFKNPKRYFCTSEVIWNSPRPPARWEIMMRVPPASQMKTIRLSEKVLKLELEFIPCDSVGIADIFFRSLHQWEFEFDFRKKRSPWPSNAQVCYQETVSLLPDTLHKMETMFVFQMEWGCPSLRRVTGQTWEWILTTFCRTKAPRNRWISSFKQEYLHTIVWKQEISSPINCYRGAF